MDGQWNNTVQNAVTSLGLCAKVCQATLENDEIAEMLKKLETCAKEYCKLDIEHKSVVESIEKTQNYFNDKENDLNIPPKKIFENFHKKSERIVNEQLEKHDLMNKYYEQIDEIEDQNEKVVHQDQDVESVVNFIPPTDPITKTTIRYPVKNTECGHIYEKESILQIISKRNMRCPYLGCPAVFYIQRKNLVDDNEMKKKIENYFLDRV